MDTVNLTIDGIPVEARKGEKVLWAALDAGIYIPNLCAIREAEQPFAGCRLCFVEIEGRPAPVTACTEEVAEGMVVHTETPRVGRLRRTSAELLIAAHHVDCRACAKNRHCELQKIAAALGIKLKPQRFRKTVKSLPIDSSNPFFLYDPNKCVVCGKCVWACSERSGADAIDFAFRGFDSVIRPFASQPLIASRCESGGECVAICPVGALVAKDFKWATQEVETICPYCGVGCGIYLGIEKGAIVSVRGNHHSPVNQGSLCVKGRFGIAEFVHHPERLVSPLIRQNGRLVQVSWQEALELIADRLANYKGKKFGLISSAKCSNEDNYVMQKFARVVMGSNNIDVYSRLCHAPSPVALRQSPGRGATSNPISDIDDAACIFVIGANPTASHPIIGQRLRRAARKGAKLIVANPRQIELCRHASLWLQHRPGSDVALLMGMMRVIVDEELADWSFIEQQCENFAPFADSLRDFDLKSVERVTAVPQELLIEAARTYASQKPGTILYASGITQHIHGSDNVAAIANLAMLTGSGMSPLQGQNNAQGACDMGALPDFYPGYQPVVDPEVNSKFEAAWGDRLNSTPGLSLGEMLHASHQGSLKALYIAGANPMLTMADAQYVQQALERVEFLIVQDLFLTETAQLAHVVLPAASFAEKDGTFTNTESRVQRVRQAIEPIGSAKPDWWIASQIARKLRAQGFDFEHTGQIMEEIARLTPSYGGISYSRLEEESVYTEGLAHGKGRFMPLSHKAAAELPDDDYPLMLVTERSLYQFGAMSRKVHGLNTLKAEEQVEINPADAASLGLADSEMVLVISPRGEVQTKAKITEASPPGVLAMGFHFAETPTNMLTNSAMDPTSKIPGLKICAVRLEKSH